MFLYCLHQGKGIGNSICFYELCCRERTKTITSIYITVILFFCLQAPAHYLFRSVYKMQTCVYIYSYIGYTYLDIKIKDCFRTACKGVRAASPHIFVYQKTRPRDGWNFGGRRRVVTYQLSNTGNCLECPWLGAGGGGAFTHLTRLTSVAYPDPNPDPDP